MPAPAPSLPTPGLPPSVQTLALARDPIGVLTRLRARHGPIFALDLLNAGHTVVVADPDAGLAIAEADPTASHAGEARRGVLPQAAEESSFGGDEETHDRARANLEPCLAPARVSELGGEIAAIAESHIAQWPRERPLRLLSRMRTLTQELFVRLVLGVADDARAAELTQAVGRALRTPGNPPLLPPSEDQGLRGSLFQALYRRRVAPVERLLAREIDDRRAHGEPGGGVLGHMLATRPETPTETAVQELVVVLAAAQEPPAIALTWILDRLSRDESLHEAFLDGTDEGRTAAFDEVLRLRPPALASLRTLTEPRDVCGHALPADTDVMVAIPLLHRDASVFEAPERFDPGRFPDGSRPAAFIPFGAGRRSCPAEDWARMQMHTVVPAVLRSLRLRFPPRPERPVQRATVLVPNRSGLAVATAA